MINIFIMKFGDHPGLFLYDKFLKVGLLVKALRALSEILVHLTNALQRGHRSSSCRLKATMPLAHTLADPGNVTLTIVIFLIIFQFGRQRFNIT